METKSSSCQAALSRRNNTSKKEKNRLSEQEEKGMTESLTSEVLRMRIKINEKSNETLNCSKNEEIDALKAKNDELNIKVGDQADKIHQLDTSNDKKNDEIERMGKRLKEILEERDNLKQNILIMTEDNASQGKKIQKLESEIEEMREELKLIRYENEKKERRFETHIEEQNTKIQRLLETVEAGFARWAPTSERRTEPSPVSRGQQFHINEAHNVQITVKNSRRELKPSKCNIP